MAAAGAAGRGVSTGKGKLFSLAHIFFLNGFRLTFFFLSYFQICVVRFCDSVFSFGWPIPFFLLSFHMGYFVYS